MSRQGLARGQSSGVAECPAFQAQKRAVTAAFQQEPEEVLSATVTLTLERLQSSVTGVSQWVINIELGHNSKDNASSKPR